MLAGGGVINGDKTINATSATVNVPTGQKKVKVEPNTSFSFTVPENVYVLYIETNLWFFNDYNHKLTAYVGVKPLTTHKYGFGNKHMGGLCEFTCATHDGINLLGKPDLPNLAASIGNYLYISWSPEINKQTPTVYD